MGVFSPSNNPTPNKNTPPAAVKGGVFAGALAGSEPKRMATDLPTPTKVNINELLKGIKPGPSSTPKTPPSPNDTRVKLDLKGILPRATEVPTIKYSKNFVPNTTIGPANPNNTITPPKGTLYEEAVKSMRPSFVKNKSELMPEEAEDNININIPFTKERVISFKNPIPKTVARNSKGVAEFVGNLPDDLAESIPRAVVSTGLALNPMAPNEIDPTTFKGEAIFGDKPIKNFTGKGKELGIENPYLAPFAGFALTAFDLYPGTSGKTKLVTNLAKETAEKEVKNLLLREVRSLSPEIIDDIAPIIAKSADRKEIDNILNNAVAKYKAEIQPRPNATEALVRGADTQSDNVAVQAQKTLPEPTQTVSEATSKYKRGADVINPNYTDDIAAHDQFISDLTTLPKPQARDIAVSRIDEVLRDTTESGIEQFRAMVDTFGRTDARKIVREGIATDTMRPAEVNKLFDRRLQMLDDAALESDLPVQIYQKGTRYYPLGMGPKIESSKVKDLLAHIIPEDKVEFVFDPDFIKKKGALGEFSFNPKMEYLNERLKPIITLYEKKGKVPVRTAFHEANHYLETKVFSKEFVQKLDDETLAIMNDADHAYYKARGYKTPEARAAEYRSDEFGRIEAKKAGYVSPLQKVFDLVKAAVKSIADGAKRFRDYVARIPNRQGGGINLQGGKKKLPQNLEEKARLIEAKEFALENHPARNLAKYAATRGEFAGQLPEVTGRGGSKFGNKGDKIIQDLTNDYYEYPEDARRGYEEYVARKKDLAQMKKEFKREVYSFEARQYIANKAKEKAAAANKATDTFIAKAEQPKKLVVRKEEPKPAPAPEPKKPNYTPEKRDEITKALDDMQKRAIAERDYKIRVREIVKDANRPFEHGDSLYTAIKRSLNPINFTDKKTKEIFTTWKRDLLVSREIANEDFKILKNIPEKEGMKVINAYEAGKATAYNKQIKESFDKLFKEAEERGLQVQYRENYLPHVYKESPAEIRNLIANRMAERGIDQGTIKDYLDGVGSLSPEQAKSLKLKPSFVKERSFDTYQDALAYGLHPKYENPAQLMAYYRHEMEKTIANNKYMKALELEGKILPESMAPKTWQEIKLTYGGKRWFAEKRFADVINGQIVDKDNMGAWPLFVNKVANISKFTQDIALSAGVPKSNINFFSTGQLIKELTSGNFKAISPYIRSNFTNASIKYFERNMDTIKAMARQGIDVGDRLGTYANSYSSVWKKLGEKDYRGFLGEGFDKLFNEKTFGAFMPQLYMGTFKSALKQAEKKGLSKEAAEVFAGNVTKKFYGMIEETGRSELTKDALAATFFAPKFRESLINTLVNTGRSVTTQIRNPEFYKNRKLLAGMAITFAMYNMLNRELNDGKNMWENEPGREMALRIPGPNGDVIYVEFMPSFLAFARSMFSGTVNLFKGDLETSRQKFGSVFSMPIKIVNDVITNKDYFGREIYKDSDSRSQKLLKIAGYIGLQVNHPYVEELLKQADIENGTARAVLNIPDEKPPLYQTISTMFEFPLKFSSMSQIQKNQVYEANRKVNELHKAEREKFRPVYDEIQALVKAGKEDEAQARLNDLSDHEYDVYRDTLANDKQKYRVEKESAFLPTYNKIQDLKLHGKTAQAQEILDGISDEEYEVYSDLADRYGGRTTEMVINGKQKPKFGENTELSERGLFDTVLTYAHAIGVDPVTAFDRIFSGQRIRRVDNGAIVVERMSLEESQAEKKKTGSDNAGFKLDHTIPLQLGGSNDEDNLRVVPTEDWAKYTPVENYLGKQLKDDKMSKKEVQDLIVKFKLGQITAEDVYNYKK